MNILDELVAKGVSGETIVKVAKLIADAEQTQKMRDSARERMRAVRERSRIHPNTREQKPAYIEERKIRKKGSKTVMPDDWKPVIEPNDIPEFKRFTDYAKANGKLYADWDAAWRNWQTSPYRKTGVLGNGRGPIQPKEDPRSIRGAFDRLSESLGPGWEDEARELSRQANLRIVSSRSGE